MAEAFAQAARALTATICEPDLVQPRDAVEVVCEAPAADLLFVDWLNALVFEMATRRMLFSRFTVRIENGVLRATIEGERVDRDRHQPAVEVKGATQTALVVGEQPGGGWVAQCVVDV
jgi:SHS2 domain-containing protein